jgi:GNAT superfamily N-acetyltransferase
MRVEKIELNDLQAILALQYLAYQSQAQLCNDFAIPPLTETLADAIKVFPDLVMLKAIDDNGAILGSVRGRPEGNTCHVGRLFVHPEYKGRGLGTQLLLEIEAACTKPRYELFTSNLSVDNIRLYERMGYVRFREEDYSTVYKLVYMEKYLLP